MGRITSSIGLVTGLDIGGTVDKLIALQARPRDQLTKLNDTRDRQQLAISGLATQLIGLQLAAGKLKLPTTYDVRKASSSSSSVLSVTTTGKPALGSYDFTPVRLAQAQRLLSSGVADKTAALGGGEVSFRFGGFIDGDASLDLLGEGAGVQPGKIRLTDRSGSSTEIDLRLARTVGDVVRTINAASGIGVRAELAGDALRLVDSSGGSGNLRVDEVAGGTTAAGLGLSGINTAANQVDGQRVYRLFGELGLNHLNDGRGLRFDEYLDDLEIAFRDGSTARVDLNRVGTSPELISATTPASGRPNAQITFRAASALPELVGVEVKFENDSTVTKGRETVAYDAQAKTLTFKIDEGNSTAQNVVSALKRNTAVSKLFTATLTGDNPGTGLVVAPDGVVLDGPRSQLTTAATLGSNSRLKIAASVSSPDYDGYQLVFQAGAAAAGLEAVDFDQQAKTITVTIADGQSTANDVVAALSADAGFAAHFQAQVGASIGSDGSGLVSLSDGATTSGGTVIPARRERTLADVLETLNAAAPGKLSASIAADGSRIELKDLSTDSGGTFQVTQLNGSRLADDLGIGAPAVGDTIASGRVLSGLGTSLLSSLAGGAGLGPLGQIGLTDRTGATATVDLASAETLEDVAELIAASGLGLALEINAARNGVVLRDTTGTTSNNLVVADADGTQSASKLGLVVDGATSSVNSGSLYRQAVSENTLLGSLNGGRGVALGTLRVTDTRGRTRELDLAAAEAETVGDVLRELNGLGLDIAARINDTGDGILLVDTGSGGAAKLQVAEGNSTTASDLHLVGTAETVDLEGTPTQVIDGRTTFTVNLAANASLDDLVAQLNLLGGGAAFSVLNDGSTVRPYRLSVISQQTGRLGQLQLDLSALGLDLEETAAAQDAVVALGQFNASGGQFVTSSNNTFRELVAGLTLQVQQTSTSAVTVSVTPDDGTLVASVQDVVDRYNAIQDQIRALTSRDPANPGLLAGSNALLQVENQLADIIGGRFLGKLGSSRSVGIRFLSPVIGADGSISAEEAEKAGRLELDSSALRAVFSNDPGAVQDLLGTAQLSLAAQLDSTVKRLASSDQALLVNQIETLNRQIVEGQRRVAILDSLLESQRQRLTNSFNRAELAISRLKDSQNALASLTLFVQSLQSNNNASN